MPTSPLPLPLPPLLGFLKWVECLEIGFREVFWGLVSPTPFMEDCGCNICLEKMKPFISYLSSFICNLSSVIPVWKWWYTSYVIWYLSSVTCHMPSLSGEGDHLDFRTTSSIIFHLSPVICHLSSLYRKGETPEYDISIICLLPCVTIHMLNINSFLFLFFYI